MDRDQTRQRDQYQGERFEEESSYRQGGERAMTYPSQDRQRQGGTGRDGAVRVDLVRHDDVRRDGRGLAGIRRPVPVLRPGLRRSRVLRRLLPGW
jgi:hypothetical protein